jgi:predicted small lipoprotein YifL
MQRFRFLVLAPLTLALMLSACGNKGDLVKPNPAAVPPKTDQPASESPAPAATTPPQESADGH